MDHSHPVVGGIVIVIGGSLLTTVIVGSHSLATVLSQATLWIVAAPILVWQSRAKVRSFAPEQAAPTADPRLAPNGLPARLGWQFRDGHWWCDEHNRRYCKPCSLG